MKKITFFLALLTSYAFPQAQDSTIIFESPNKDIVKPVQTEMNDAWGVDILLSNNGFGAAGFYRREFTKEIFGTITLGVAQSKDDNEIEYVDWYGRTYAPGKINRFLVVPVHAGIQYRLFADEITDSFRPYVNAGFGPTVVLVHPYENRATGEQIEYFKSLRYLQPRYTIGGYIGLGAFFGTDLGSLSGINIRYYFIPFSGGIESLEGPREYYTDPNDPNNVLYKPGKISKKTDFGGFFITINLGTAF